MRYITRELYVYTYVYIDLDSLKCELNSTPLVKSNKKTTQPNPTEPNRTQSDLTKPNPTQPKIPRQPGQ